MEAGLFVDTALALWALAVGMFLCAVYDVFRVFRLRKKQNSVALFFCDILFCVICASVMSVLFFNLSFGRPRAYAFAFAFAGFLIWRFTVSRAVIALMLKIFGFAEKLLNSLKMRVSAFLFRLSRCIYTVAYCRSAAIKAKNGFGIIKRKEFKNDKKETGAH